MPVLGGFATWGVTSFIGEGIGQFVLWMAVMAFDPFPSDRAILGEFAGLVDEVRVFAVWFGPCPLPDAFERVL